MNDQLSEGKAPMFIPAAYDTAAIAMLGFGVLASPRSAVPFLARPLLLHQRASAGTYYTSSQLDEVCWPALPTGNQLD